MAFSFSAYAAPGAVSTPRLVESVAQGNGTQSALPSRLSYGQNIVKFPGFVCAASVNEVGEGSSNAAPPRRGRPKSTNSSTTTKAVRKNAEGKRVVDGTASDEYAHMKETENQNGKPKPAVHLFEYEDGPWPCSVSIVPHLHDVAEAVADYIARISEESIKARGYFSIVLSGGSLVKALSALVKEPHASKLNWSKWFVFWADERMVPISHADSNYNDAKHEFLSKVPIPDDNLVTIDDWDVCSAAANGYEARLKEMVKRKILHTTNVNHHKFPRFDLVLLGIGPDGHVASLFPNSLQLAETKKWVVPITKSPKPPSRRISLSLPCINGAAHVAIVVVGSSKAEVLQRVFERPALPGALPAQLVRPRHGELAWFVDKQAAGRLSIEHYNDPKKFPFLDWSSLKEAKESTGNQI
ncbi:probable 6-phosphogluconolactonase 1 isoform X2 [Physcomitrium patens]|uniref:Glucosamine/galactosamine-6-phosphate isomerase domain-containing protein n=1 Tax=Physcomitrium patens TaxID=3218 RepID=A0A2K1IH55_PHYPA|nr:probable 6-phosphogluconolactonase 1 isoform X2 [Physcomitrium patens]XP_024363237.1 probable 6-phosphogluconolactonase 1 isoform X2 [Physcomitrium patens]XP_024363238.1 probable 6-phosphogluconolactonase 1 isoform X2 [Physcomitrium patens]XP_024363239.1 probable 6-phosphogluconolactonase 1 isoform X2 [Physcomitrium patens]XP_024363240.1 probable 6-phosphogluconolactonase 1 isoform X2 [Physcomitrium patens]XP_024363241.1 probable 6-phosphogluconolactonase 1 isoform X2 [Physcomitrium patens]|eukprot:XP_024363236.1 probable 6-phosphogluconolactonase 1 isoform X2 [Physcomitrella patens]